MKILLLGEYSGVYTELAEGLRELGHEVTLINDGDGYKRFPSSFRVIYDKRKEGLIFRIIHYLAYRIGVMGFFSFQKQWRSLKTRIVGFDVVQVVNPVIFSGWGSIPNYIIWRRVFHQNSCVFLSVLGFDYYQITWSEKYNNISGFYSPSFQKFLRPDYAFKYKYCLFYKGLNDYAIKCSRKIIPGLLEYKTCYDWTRKTTAVIPFPLSKDKLGEPFKLAKGESIIIFHGWQKGKEKFKGNDIIDEVLKRIEGKYGNRVKYIVVQDVPFEEYIKLYKKCHLFIDQLYTRDKGMNGLLGMASGKVVLSGLCSDSLNAYPFYQGEMVGISAQIDKDLLYQSLCNAIESPQLLEQISQNAIEFVRNNHLTNVVAQMYLNVWEGK